MTLLKLTVAILITIALVIFAMANTHFTVVSFVAGSPVQIRLIVLLIGTYLFGVVSVVIFFTVRKVRVSRIFAREPLWREGTDYVEDFD